MVAFCKEVEVTEQSRNHAAKGWPGKCQQGENNTPRIYYDQKKCESSRGKMDHNISRIKILPVAIGTTRQKNRIADGKDFYQSNPE